MQDPARHLGAVLTMKVTLQVVQNVKDGPTRTTDDVHWRQVASCPWVPGRELSPEAPKMGHCPAGGCPAPHLRAAEDASRAGDRPAVSCQPVGLLSQLSVSTGAAAAAGALEPRSRAPCCSGLPHLWRRFGALYPRKGVEEGSGWPARAGPV